MPVIHTVQSTTESVPEKVKIDYRNRDLTEAVVIGVSDAAGVDPLDLEPLNTAVDPDALNKLFQPTVGDAPASAELRFSMADCQVVIHGSGELVVTPPSADDKTKAAVPAQD